MRANRTAGILLLVVSAVCACTRERPEAASPPPETVAAVQGATPPDAAPAAASQGAVPPRSATSPAPVAFDADAAWDLLAAQVAFGPRVPGSEAHRRCADWLAARLAEAGARVTRDTFSYRDPEGTTWPLENILGSLGPPGGGRILLVAHWDTRPWADMDPDSSRRSQPIPGANDGASGVAILLQVARSIRGADLPRGIDILLVDGEDLGRPDNRAGYCRGSRRFAERGPAGYWRAIVLDMVGDVDLEIPVEGNSVLMAPEVVDWVWSRAQTLAPEIFPAVPGPTVLDDHVPLLDAGIPTVDLIDMDYAAWHTLADDLPAVSRESLGAVGRVVLSLVQNP